MAVTNEKWFYDVCRAVTDASTVFQSFLVGYIDDLYTNNAGQNYSLDETLRKEYPLVLLPYPTIQTDLVRAKTTLACSFYFFATQYKKGQNRPDPTHLLEDYAAELRLASRDWLAALAGVDGIDNVNENRIVSLEFNTDVLADIAVGCRADITLQVQFCGGNTVGNITLPQSIPTINPSLLV